tara:strand:- start:2659 stop:3306 length:648 start_codon:yes stop_codon:yes gene_type:complete
MGVLDNTTITVDAILTKKGRELLAQGEGKFKITQFALADDEIDYGLYDITHPNGSNFYGAAIENMNLLEAIPNQTLAVKYFLTNEVGDGTTAPIVNITGTTSIKALQTGVFTATTDNFANELYEWVLEDTTYASLVTAGGRTAAQTAKDEELGVAQGYAGNGAGGASTSSAIGTSVTVRCKSKGVLGGQDRQVVLTARGVTSGKPANVTINLVRD